MSSTRVDITVFPRTDFAAPGWEFTQADADVQAWFPAVHTQTQQFRSRERAVLDHSRHLRTRLDEIMQGVFVDEFTVPKFPAIYAQTQTFRAAATPSLRLTRHLDLWRPEPATVFVPEIFVPFDPARHAAMLQLLHSFRSTAAPSLDLTRHVRPQLDEIMQGVFIDLFTVPKFAAVHAQTQSFRVGARPLHEVQRHLDLWRYEPHTLFEALFPELDPQLWPAIETLTRQFRSASPTELNVALQQYLQSLDYIASVIDITPSLAIDALIVSDVLYSQSTRS